MAAMPNISEFKRFADWWENQERLAQDTRRIVLLELDLRHNQSPTRIDLSVRLRLRAHLIHI